MSTNTLPSWPEQVAGVILAGGRSRRMGRDKALVAFRGAPLIEIAEAKLRQAGCTEIYISGPSSYHLSCPNIPDQHQDAGPLGGLSAVLNSLAASTRKCRAIVTIPVDCPELRPETLTGLACESGAAILKTESRPHPTVGRWPLELRELLERYLAKGGRTFAEFAECAGARNIFLDDADQLTNINTPSDL